MAREHLSLRVDPATRAGLEREAARRGTPKTALAERFLREAVQTAGHPGITFRDGPAGRRAGVVGGPDVWEVVEVWRDEGRVDAAAATTLELPPGLIAEALSYYADNREEIEGWIDRNRALSEVAEAAALRRLTLSQG